MDKILEAANFEKEAVNFARILFLKGKFFIAK
jgi:hypothetical protein